MYKKKISPKAVKANGMAIAWNALNIAGRGIILNAFEHLKWGNDEEIPSPAISFDHENEK